MKIISPYHDYYDSCLAYGQDDRVVYMRTPQEFDMNNRRGVKPPALIKDIYEIARSLTQEENVDHYWGWMTSQHAVSSIRTKKGLYEFDYFAILFCGKYYPAVRCERKAMYPSDLPDAEDWFYAFDDFTEYLLRACDYDAEKERKSKWSKNTVADMLRVYFAASKQPDIEWMIEHKVTNVVVEWDRDHVLVNHPLKDFEFYKVMDPFTTYQELDMWVGGTLAWPQNMMVEVSDKDRIVQHGFDVKYGFRKRPEK